MPSVERARLGVAGRKELRRLRRRHRLPRRQQEQGQGQRTNTSTTGHAPDEIALSAEIFAPMSLPGIDEAGEAPSQAAAAPADETGDLTTGREDHAEVRSASPDAPRENVRTESSLGDRVRGVPLEVHMRMEELFRQQLIPLTTFEQRSRRGTAVRTRGTTYDVMPSLQEAFDYGYTSPNFPDAPLSRWVRQPGRYQLRRYCKGG